MKIATHLSPLICSLSVLGAITSTANDVISPSYLLEENALTLTIEKMMSRF